MVLSRIALCSFTFLACIRGMFASIWLYDVEHATKGRHSRLVSACLYSNLVLVHESCLDVRAYMIRHGCCDHAQPSYASYSVLAHKHFKASPSEQFMPD